jgi:hypothetical protein
LALQSVLTLVPRNAPIERRIEITSWSLYQQYRSFATCALKMETQEIAKRRFVAHRRHDRSAEGILAHVTYEVGRLLRFGLGHSGRLPFRETVVQSLDVS